MKLLTTFKEIYTSLIHYLLLEDDIFELHIHLVHNVHVDMIYVYIFLKLNAAMLKVAVANFVI